MKKWIFIGIIVAVAIFLLLPLFGGLLGISRP